MLNTVKRIKQVRADYKLLSSKEKRRFFAHRVYPKPYAPPLCGILT